MHIADIPALLLGAADVAVRRLIRQSPDASKATNAEQAPHPDYENMGAWGLSNPDKVIQRFGPDAYSQMIDRDPEILNGIEELIADVVSAGWTIKPADDSDEAEEQAEFIRINIANIGGQHPGVYQTPESFFEELLENGLTEGMAIGEKVWWAENGKVYISHVAFKPSSMFDIKTDDYGNLTALGFAESTKAGTDIEPSRMLVFPYAARFGNWYGRSRLRRLWTAYQLKDVTVKSLGIYVQKAGSGALVGKIPQDKYSAWKTVVLEAIKQVNAETATVFPEWVEITNLLSGTNAGTADVFASVIDICNRQIRIGLMGSTLGTDVSDTGSRAVAGDQRETRRARIAMIRAAEAAVIRKQIIEPLCDLNFATTAPGWPGYPTFVRDPGDDRDPKDIAETMVRVANLGGRFSPRWTERVLNIELDNADDEMLLLAVTGKQLPDGIGVLSDHKPAITLAAQPEVDRRREASARNLLTIEALAEGAMAQHYSDMIRWAQTHPDEVMAGMWSDDADRRKALRGIIRRGVEMGVQFVVAMRPVEFAVEDWQYGDFIPQLAIDEIDRVYMDRYFAEFEPQLRDEFAEIWRRGIDTGQSMEDIAAEIARKAGIDPTEQETGKRYGESNWRLRRQIRTMSTELYNLGKYQAGQRAAWVDGYQYSAVLDDRTTEFCREHDGQYFDKTDAALGSIIPPNHWHCRSDMIPVYAEEVDRWRRVDEFETTPDEGFDQPIRIPEAA